MNIYLTAGELSERIKYDVRYIRERLKDKVFVKGIHYLRPFGGRKILFIWDEIEKIMDMPSEDKNPMDKIRLRRRSS